MSQEKTPIHHKGGLQQYKQNVSQDDAQSVDMASIYEEYKDRVLMFARRMGNKIPSGSPLTVEDLASCGAIGLMEAVERFDPDRGILFSTFADYRIRGAMIDAIRSNDHMSRHRREQERDLDIVKVELTKILGRTPRPRELAKEMDIPLEKLYRLQANVAKVTEVSIDGDEREESRSLLDILSNDSQEDPITTIMNEQIRSHVREAIMQLEERPRQCILLYYGRSMNLTEISEVFELTPSRISQILSNARKTLRYGLEDIAAYQGFSIKDNQ
jgi:RNA polymerase sigma factor FliA